MKSGRVLLCLLAATASAAEVRADRRTPVFETDEAEPAPLRLAAVQINLGYGTSILDLGVRGLVIEPSGFLMDVEVMASLGEGKPVLGVTGDLLVGWAFGWGSRVRDEVMTAEAHTVRGLYRYNYYETVGGDLPARPHFAIVGGGRVLLRRGLYPADYREPDRQPVFVRFAAGIELAKRWGGVGRFQDTAQFLWGYSGVRLLFLSTPQEGDHLRGARRWPRYGGAFQWFQTTRTGRFRATFRLTLAFEPIVGPSIQLGLTLPFHIFGRE